MPLPFLYHLVVEGTDDYPWVWTVLKLSPLIAIIAVLKIYFAGAVNKSERLMHGKVVMITGGTSGIGAEIARDLASRGAQIILLTHHAGDDPFLQDYIEDMRETTNNEMIYVEPVNLNSLYSIRQFATKWIDNAPPRRLDMLVLCANTFNPAYSPVTTTAEGVESCWGLNYLANFHLLSILSPALRAQPPDRDVRIIVATCGSYVGGDLQRMKKSKAPLPKQREYETSKLALMVFAQAFQKHLDAYKRPDKMPMNTRVITVDPGWSRTPGMRRWLCRGSLWGLLVYLLFYPIFWLVLKSPIQGAQSFLQAAMEAEYGRGVGGRFIRECRDWKYARSEINDEKVQKELWGYSEQQIQVLEKAAAADRAEKAKKEGKNEQSSSATQQHQKQQPNAKGAAAGETASGASSASTTASKKDKQDSSRRSRKAGSKASVQ